MPHANQLTLFRPCLSCGEIMCGILSHEIRITCYECGGFALTDERAHSQIERFEHVLCAKMSNVGDWP